MLAKCANPDCPKAFLYLREGKLFHLRIPVPESGQSDQAADIASGSAVRDRMELFWLCDYCSERMTVVWKSGQGFTAVPLKRYKAAS